MFLYLKKIDLYTQQLFFKDRKILFNWEKHLLMETAWIKTLFSLASPAAAVETKAPRRWPALKHKADSFLCASAPVSLTMASHTLPAHSFFLHSLQSPGREHAWERKPPHLPARVPQKRAGNQEEQTTVTCRMEPAAHKGKAHRGDFGFPEPPHFFCAGQGSF